MKIAFIVPSLACTGPIVVVHTIISNLIGEDCSVEVYYFDNKQGLDFPCRVTQLNMQTPINFDEYDIIHSHGYRPDKYVNRWRKRIKQAKTVSTIHSDIASDLAYSYNRIVSIIFTYRWLNIIKNQDAITVISDKLHNIYKCRFYQLNRIHNGVDIALDSTRCDELIISSINSLKASGFRVIGTYAYLTKCKGLEQLVYLIAERKDLALVIIGQGPALRELITEVTRLGLCERVVFFDYLPAPYNYVPFFDVYAMCSRSEGFGLALVEAALAHGRIVCSNIEVFNEIFSQKEVSYFELDNLASLSNAVNVALSYNGEGKIKLAYSRAIQCFSGMVMAKNYLRLYHSLGE